MRMKTDNENLQCPQTENANQNLLKQQITKKKKETKLNKNSNKYMYNFCT